MFTSAKQHKYANNDVSGKFHAAVVIANDDSHSDTPHKQKIQFRQSEMHKGYNDTQLPWALPIAIKAPNGFGGGAAVCIPAVGSMVWIFYPEDNDDHAYYDGDATIGGTLPAELLADYPNGYGYLDKAGNLEYTNITQKTRTIWMATGQQLQFLQDGSINIISAKDLNFRASGDLNLSAVGSLRLNAAQIHLNEGAGTADGLTTQNRQPPTPTNPSNQTDY